MLSFAAEFPLKSGSPKDVLTCIGVWLKGSPHRAFSVEQIDALTNGRSAFIEASRQDLQVISLGEDFGEAIGAKHTAVDQNIIYSTTIVSRTVDSVSWVSIRTDRASLDPQISLKEARKPQIVKVLLRELGGGLDGELWVSDNPVLLTSADENMAVRLLNGDSDNHLPVVYISRTFYDELSCDPAALARQLGGMAHVVVEPTRTFSRAIQPHTNSRNAYGGAVGVYLSTGQRSLILANDKTDWEIRNAAASLVRDVLLTRLPLEAFSWPDVEAERSRRNIEFLKSQGSTDLDAFVREFDAENHALKEQNEALATEIRKLKAEFHVAHAKSSALSGENNALLVQDYFKGESEHFLKEALSQALLQVVKGSRKEMVLKEYADKLKSSDEMEIRRKKLKEVLSTSNDLDNKASQVLNELGFSIKSEGKHHKLTYYGDSRLTFTMAKTASDWRAGKNMASDIIKKVY